MHRLMHTAFSPAAGVSTPTPCTKHLDAPKASSSRLFSKSRTQRLAAVPSLDQVSAAATATDTSSGASDKHGGSSSGSSSEQRERILLQLQHQHQLTADLHADEVQRATAPHPAQQHRHQQQQAAASHSSNEADISSSSSSAGWTAVSQQQMRGGQQVVRQPRYQPVANLLQQVPKPVRQPRYQPVPKLLQQEVPPWQQKQQQQFGPPQQQQQQQQEHYQGQQQQWQRLQQQQQSYAYLQQQRVDRQAQQPLQQQQPQQQHRQLQQAAVEQAHQHRHQQQQQQQQQVTKPFLITGRLQREAYKLLADSNPGAADALLCSSIRRIKTLGSLLRTATELDRGRLLRPAAVAALIVRLGKLATRAAKQTHADRVAAARRVRRTNAVAGNARRMAVRRQRQLMLMHQQQQHQQQQQQVPAGQQGQQQQQRQQQQLPGQLQHPQFQQLQSPVGDSLSPRQQSAGAEGSSSSSRSGKAARLYRSRLKQRQRRRLKFARLQRRMLLFPQQAYEAVLAAKVRPFQQQLQRMLFVLKRDDTAVQLRPKQFRKLCCWLRHLRVQDGVLWQMLQQAAQQQLGGTTVSSSSSSIASPAQQVMLLWGLARQATAANSSSRVRGGNAAAAGRMSGVVVSAAGVAGTISSSSGGSSSSSSSSSRVGVQPRRQQQQVSVQPEYVAAWLESSTQHLAAFTPGQLAASIYSLALLQQQQPPAWQAAFFTAFLPQLHKASPRELSTTLWGLAKLGLKPEDSWWGPFQAAVTGQLGKLSGVAVANIVWAAGKLGLRVQPQFGDLLLWQAQRRFAAMDIQLLSSLLWGVVKLGLQPKKKWLHRFGDRVTVLYGSLTPNYFASLLLSLSSLQYRPKHWMARTLTAVQPQLRAFSPSDIAQTLVAFSRMHYAPHTEWWFEFTLEARRAVPRVNKQQLLMIANGLAVLSSSGEVRVAPELLAAVLERARVLLGVAAAETSSAAGAAEGSAAAVTAAVASAAAASEATNRSSSSSSRSNGFTAADCANLAQSLVHLHVAPGATLVSGLYTRFVTVLQQQQQQQQPDATASQPPTAAAAGVIKGTQIATMLWALGAFWRSNSECLWLRQHPDIIAALVNAAQPHLSTFEPLQLKRSLVALAAMGYNPGPAFLLAHEAAVLGRVDEFWPKTLEHILRAYKELGFSGQGQSVLREALARQQQQQQQQQQG